VTPIECVFIDDTQTWLDKAKALGMHTIRATNTSETISLLKTFLLSYSEQDDKFYE
jgi:FMN phosphatase YigB (HAD superfamily)